MARALDHPVYAVLAVPLQLGLGLLIAYLLFQKIRYRQLLRTLSFLPYITSTLVSAAVSSYLYSTDPEVVPIASRRPFGAAEKGRVLHEADACSQPSHIGALLRREGFYSSQLAKRRHLRARGHLQAPTPQL